VIGCSTGYGLASRITAAFGSGAKHWVFVMNKHHQKNRLCWLLQYVCFS